MCVMKFDPNDSCSFRLPALSVKLSPLQHTESDGDKWLSEIM